MGLVPAQEGNKKLYWHWSPDYAWAKGHQFERL